MIREGFTCDICGIDKKEANHWFTALEDKGTLKLNAWGMMNRKHQVKHLCGQGCVHRFVDDFLAKNSTNEVSPDASAAVTGNIHNYETDDQEIDLPVK
jgi:hypothetical protein